MTLCAVIAIMALEVNAVMILYVIMRIVGDDKDDTTEMQDM